MGKRKQAAATVGAIAAEPTAANVAVSEPQSADQPPFEPTGTYTPEANEPDGEPSATRGRFRSWSTAPAQGYTKLTDTEKHRIVLLFDEKPMDDVRTAMKGAGFQYHPDYEGHSNAWTRYNDYEGRLQTEAIEKLIRELNPGTPSPER